jgi:hypothetical protein
MPIQTAIDSISNSQGSPFGFKNRIINGAMVIDQRNAGASVTLAGGGTYTVDRWQGYEDTDGVMTAQQNSSAPTGFINSLKLTTTTADSSLASTQFALIQQKIEGLNIADLGWGTASAATVSLSFWVRSSLTGTFGGSLRNSAQDRSYPFTFTISVVDTWEQKTVTIAGDTSGTWLTTNGIGIQVCFGLGVGSTYSGTSGSWAAAQYFSATGATSVIGTLNATFYITGVQLEKGTQATAFDYRPYSTELDLCQRYYSQLVGNYSPDFQVPNSSYANYFTHSWKFPQVMRAAPTVSQISGTTVAMDQFGIGPATISSNQIGSINQFYGRITVITSSPSSAAPGTAISPTGTFWQASAEL